MNPKSLVIILVTLLSFNAFSQTSYNVRSRISGLDHNHQCGNDASGQPDPRWKVWWAYDAATFTQFTAGASYCSNVYGGNGFACGLDASYNLLTAEMNNVTTTQFNVDMECWEEDGCGGSADCTAGGNGLCNADDIQTSRGRIANISYRNQPPCSEFNWGIFYRIASPTNYGAEVRINWSYNTINPADIGSIDGTGQTLCTGGDPSIINSITSGLPHTAYQWQSSPNGSTWSDIPGANLSTYDPPIIATTTHYRRKETLCVGATIASSSATDYFTNTHIVTIETASIAPTMVTSNPASVCGTGIVMLTASGGTLGTGAMYQWYDDACGGTLIGTTATPVLTGVSVSASTSYFVRISGTCNTTGCVSTTVNVSSPATAATSASASAMTICSGTAVTLTAVGGSLGSSGSWEWYDLGCGSGINVGSGTSISVSPTTTTTYFVRAEGGCTPTTCQSVTITVEQPSTDPSSINASALSYCSPGSSTLTLVGGTLGTAATWQWYEAGCGAGTALGTGTSITVSPTTTTTYYARGEGTCNNTACVNVTITVDQSGTAPSGIVAGNSSLCPGQSTTLSVTGGSLGTGATWEWYSGSCGGTPAGSGNTIAITPGATTTYFVRAEGTCGNSACATTTVTIGVGSADPTAATVINNNICPGDTAQVFVTGPTLPIGYSWVWYTGACGAIPVGIGDTISVTPTANETYYVRAVGTCGATNCVSTTVTVQNGSIAATGISTDNNDFCEGGTANLTITGGSLVAAAQWTWYANSCGGTSIGTGSTLSVSPTSSTTYYARAEGGTCGNTECRSISISVLEANAYLVAFEDQCGIGQPFELDNGLPAGGTYSGTGVIGGDFDPTVAGIGTHTITYTYNDPNGCNASVTADITLGTSTITGAATVEVETCSDGGIILQATATGGNGFYTYEWSDGSSGNPLTYVEPGTYHVTITDGNNCSTTITDIEVAEGLACIEVANTFTPNGDGMNDTWNLDFTANNSARLQVFSKWGTLVYETTELTINWNGNSSDGAVLPAGTYYYILDLDNGTTTQNGPISIVR